jgi:chlorobactene glucosyltransferase
MLFYIISIVLTLTLFFTLSNLFQAARFSSRKFESNAKPKVSVLIPARNEENNIESCLIGVLNQDYLNLEIIVLNDKSTDRTGEIIREVISRKEYQGKNIKVQEGTELPSGWAGKCWACHNLSLSSTGEILLFIDADVQLSPTAVSSMLYWKEKFNLNGMTVYPSQTIKTWSENIFVPIFAGWFVVSFLVLMRTLNSKNPEISAVNGQFLMFERPAYEKIGGHESLKGSYVEDYDLGINTKRAGLRLLTFVDNGLVRCRMYTSFNECIKGYAKNYMSVSPLKNGPGFLFQNIAIFIVFLLPFILVFFNPIYLILIGIIFLQRIIQAYISRMSIIKAVLLHPFQVLGIFWVGWASYKMHRNKAVVWKDRVILDT